MGTDTTIINPRTGLFPGKKKAQLLHLAMHIDYTADSRFFRSLCAKTTDATGDMFGGVSPPTTINYPAGGSADSPINARGVLTWTPCDGDAGMYYYCMTAVSTPLQVRFFYVSPSSKHIGRF